VPCCAVHPEKAPLISVFGLCYFIVIYLVDRYQIIYTTRTSWQGTHFDCTTRAFLGAANSQLSLTPLSLSPSHSGGATMWPLIFHMFMTSLMLFQLAMIVRLPQLTKDSSR
jgi:hypothetical protein